MPYLSLPECCAAQLLKCRQEEFPSGPEECCICTEVSAQAGGMESQPQPACKINSPEATADEWEVPFPFDKGVGKAKGCIYLFGVTWTLIYLMLWFLNMSWLMTCKTYRPISVDLASFCIWVKVTAASRWGRTAQWNFYSSAGVGGVSWSPELSYSSPSQWNNQAWVSWGEEGRGKKSLSLLGVARHIVFMWLLLQHFVR